MRESVQLIKNGNRWYKVFPDYSLKQVRISKQEAIESIELAKETHDLFEVGDLNKTYSNWTYWN